MPLKSATCGRELEVGLRRRPGSNNVTFDGKPLDGVFVMHNRILAKYRTFANEKGIHFFGRYLGDINVPSHGSAKGPQLTPIGFKTLTKCFSEGRISFAYGLKVHCSSPRSKSPTSRSRRGPTLR